MIFLQRCLSNIGFVYNKKSDNSYPCILEMISPNHNPHNLPIRKNNIHLTKHKIKSIMFDIYFMFDI